MSRKQQFTLGIVFVELILILNITLAKPQSVREIAIVGTTLFAVIMCVVIALVLENKTSKEIEIETREDIDVKDYLPKTGLEMMNLINWWISERYKGGSKEAIEAGKLWSIMVALRGPDSEVRELKNNITGVIRAAVVPSVEKLGAYVSKDINTLTLGLEHARDIEDELHFYNHAHSAARVIPELDAVVKENLEVPIDTKQYLRRKRIDLYKEEVL